MPLGYGMNDEIKDIIKNMLMEPCGRFSRKATVLLFYFRFLYIMLYNTLRFCMAAALVRFLLLKGLLISTGFPDNRDSKSATGAQSLYC